MNKISLFLFSFFIFFVLSCKEKIESDESVAIPSISLSVAPDKDGIIRDITSADTAAYMQKVNQMADRSLGLQSLRNGFDKLEIRIWNEHSAWDYKGKLLVLRNKNDTWNAVLYNYKYVFDSHLRNIDTILGERRQLARPKSGWNGFLKQLFDLNILTLPDYRHIPSYSLGMDEVGVHVQLGLKNMYRSYMYPTPNARAKEIPEAKNMVEIIKLIETELGVDEF
jgi:hypothetical protein